MDTEYAIISENLTKKFGKILAVDHLNIKIPYGITFGLLGPNGAGKTTTVRMLNSIIKPTSGKALVAGYDIFKEKNKVKINCGFLPETIGLYEKLTAREFLEFVGSLYYLPESTIESRIDDLLKLFGLNNRESDLLEGYSKGMRQKVSLCASIIHDPKILFLDEPTANLDPASASMVKKLISNLVKKADKTFFICTHFLDIAEDLCDLIAMIDRGVLKIQGPPKEVIQSTGANSLEEAYIKVMQTTYHEDLLNWSNSRIKSDNSN
ncbi:MAG: ABC transporter ATP-binding protein [Candidatus Hodarchaeota archaeon]